MFKSSIPLNVSAVLALTGFVPPNEVTGDTPATEPNAQMASTWWPEMMNVWTPIGWKDHLFRFNVLYNGIIIAEPNPEVGAADRNKQSTVKYAGQGVQLTFIPWPDEKVPDYPTTSYILWSAMLPRGGCPKAIDGGIGNHGWANHSTPVLWTDWVNAVNAGYPHHGGPSPGIVLRQEVFAHIPGAGDIQTGIEPLYAWIRLSVRHVDQLQAAERYGFLVKINKPHINRSMDRKTNLQIVPESSLYPRPLHGETFTAESGSGCYVVEGDGRIRLAALPTKTARYKFIDYQPENYTTQSKDSYLYVELPARRGAHADLLLPMLPIDRAQLAAEMAVGYEKALEQSDHYWSIVPDTAARIETPETLINDAIEYSVKFAELITERNPDTGQYTFVSGSWWYDVLWPTPTSTTSHFLLDPLGYHSTVAKHIEIFREEQGTVVPPGPSYKLHPGYFSSPRSLTAFDWLADHGAILHEICQHALLSGDRGFIDHWLDNIILACEFLRDARAITGHGGVPGVLPPAIATDSLIGTQAVWNMGWNYKGLATAVRLLRRIAHPRAEEFAQEARAARETFVKALRTATQKMPQWTDDRGSIHRIVPSSLSPGLNLNYIFDIDTGPLFLVWAGLVDAADPMMTDSLLYYREGPNTKLYDPSENYWQRPVLVHEVSHLEASYSWNVFHSHQLGDRYRYLEGMYSLFTGGLSRQTYIGSEIRHGISGNIISNTLAVYLARLAVVDDVIHEDELHLLRLVPLAWVSSEQRTRFENMPTEFGPVTITFKLTEQAKTLDVSYRSSFRHKPKKVMLHLPPVTGLNKVTINGRAVAAAPGAVVPLQ